VRQDIAVGCGCSDLSFERKLAPEQWSQYVFAEASGRDRRVVFLGAANDRPEADKIVASVNKNGAWAGALDNKCGALSLRESLQLLARCEEFWGIDSSLLHCARLLGLRIKAFMGPTHPMRLRPVPGLQEHIHYRRTVCSPCIHLVSKPPCHGNNICMKWLFDAEDPQDPRDTWIPVTVDTALTEKERL
jgi:ADP-heptose:LPS heptosyltransferase